MGKLEEHDAANVAVMHDAANVAVMSGMLPMRPQKFHRRTILCVCVFANLMSGMPPMWPQKFRMGTILCVSKTKPVIRAQNFYPDSIYQLVSPEFISRMIIIDGNYNQTIELLITIIR